LTAELKTSSNEVEIDIVIGKVMRYYISCRCRIAIALDSRACLLCARAWRSEGMVFTPLLDSQNGGGILNDAKDVSSEKNVRLKLWSREAHTVDV
jgi:hypothetical protein